MLGALAAVTRIGVSACLLSGFLHEGPEERVICSPSKLSGASGRAATVIFQNESEHFTSVWLMRAPALMSGTCR